MVQIGAIKETKNCKCELNYGGAYTGVGKLFARRAALEKIFKPRAALIRRAKKRLPPSHMSFILRNISKEQKLRSSACFTVRVYIPEQGRRQGGAWPPQSTS